MVRPTKCRRVASLPGVTYFKPAGRRLCEIEAVVVSIEELEAVRLRDLEDLEQMDAAARMGISRTTYARVLDSARTKIADALVNGKALRFEGGIHELTCGCPHNGRAGVNEDSA